MSHSSRKIVVFFGKNRYAKDPFADFGNKQAVYHQFFQYGTEIGCQMYIVCGFQNHKGNGIFANGMLYRDGTFFQITDLINADAVYDRSGGLLFPPEDFKKKILNTLSFKELCADKNKTYALLKEKMPKSVEIKNKKDLLKALFSSQKTLNLSVEPANGFGGENIFFGKLAHLQKQTLETKKTYTLQEFVNTSKGIPEIVVGYHDLRVVIVNGEIIFSTIRTPKPGENAQMSSRGELFEKFP